MMLKRNALAAVTLAAVTLTAGCSGPTKTGIEAREQARARMDVFNAQFAYDAARQEFESGQFDRALHSIERAITQAPEVAECEVLKGRIYIEKHDLEKALAAFNEAIRKDPDVAEAHYYAGVVYQRWSEDEEAFTAYENARRLEPGNVQYLLASAETLVTLGETDAAERMIEAKMEYFEHNPALRQLLAQIALLQGEPEKAVRLYSNARILDPDNISLLEELAWTQYDCGFYAQCHDTVKELQGRIEEQRLDLVHLEAGCLSRMGRAAEAHRLYTTLTESNPRDVNIWIEFGTLAWELRDLKRLKTCADRVVALAPERHEGYLLEGVWQQEQGSLDKAIESFERAADVDPDAVLPLLMLGSAHERSGDTSAALLAYDNAMQVAPSHREARKLYERLEQKVQASVPTD